ncbi:hypothetical protein KJ813_06485, partial [bacterium]|nr:hypothetical protein [bacterium]
MAKQLFEKINFNQNKIFLFLYLFQSDLTVIYTATPTIFLPPLSLDYNLREGLFYGYNYGIFSGVTYGIYYSFE